MSAMATSEGQREEQRKRRKGGERNRLAVTRVMATEKIAKMVGESCLI